MTKKILCLIFLFCTISAGFAQRQKLKNIPYIDQRRAHYGFMAGLSLNDVVFTHNDNSWFAECRSINPSFCVGLMGDLAITEDLSLRCSPNINFISRDITFRHPYLAQITRQNLKSCLLQVPLSMKFASKRLNNYRIYVLGGGSIDFDLAKTRETPIVFRNIDYGIHIALGCDSYLPFFKLCPELRFNMGLNNMIDHKRKGLKDETLMEYTNAIKKARNKSVSLVFFFE